MLGLLCGRGEVEEVEEGEVCWWVVGVRLMCWGLGPGGVGRHGGKARGLATRLGERRGESSVRVGGSVRSRLAGFVCVGGNPSPSSSSSTPFSPPTPGLLAPPLPPGYRDYFLYLSIEPFLLATALISSIYIYKKRLKKKKPQNGSLLTMSSQISKRRPFLEPWRATLCRNASGTVNGNLNLTL